MPIYAYGVQKESAIMTLAADHTITEGTWKGCLLYTSSNASEYVQGLYGAVTNILRGTLLMQPTIKAVSYTHLDVYKRQLLPTTLLAPSPPTGKEDCGLVHGAAA